MKSKEKSLEEAVINLYLDLKVRRSDQEVIWSLIQSITLKARKRN